MTWMFLNFLWSINFYAKLFTVMKVSEMFLELPIFLANKYVCKIILSEESDLDFIRIYKFSVANKNLPLYTYEMMEVTRISIAKNIYAKLFRVRKVTWISLEFPNFLWPINIYAKKFKGSFFTSQNSFFVKEIFMQNNSE